MDEAGFRFSRADTQLPINTFSNKCQLRVDFSYSVISDMIKEKRKVGVREHF